MEQIKKLRRESIDRSGPDDTDAKCWKLASCVVVLNENHTEFLTVQSLKRPHSARDLPGGKVEPHETYLQAAVRELFEETALEVKESDLVLLHESGDMVRDTYWVKTYLAIVYQGEARPGIGEYSVAWRPLIEMTDQNQEWSKYNSAVYHSLIDYLKTTHQ